jgi:hypothetical protein
MTFDRAKIIAEGGKYHGTDNMLVECATFVADKVSRVPVAECGVSVPSHIKEDANLPKRMVIEGVFQRAGVKNANGRTYPRGLWERLLSEDGGVMRRIRERAMIGHLEHPTEGTTDLNKGAILIVEAWMEADGTIRGRAIVYNTPEGLRLQEYIETGTKVGISSRGTGTVDARGNVCEDFQLETWDMVYNPSTPGAHPTLKTESTDKADPKTSVVENTTHTPSNPSRQDKPMSLSKRIAEARASVTTILAVDPKRLTVEARQGLAADLLDARARIAESFKGDERVPEVTAIMADLEKAKATCETTTSGAVSGIQAADVGDTVQSGVPGTWDALDKLSAGAAGPDKEALNKQFRSVAEMIAANIGKLPQIVAAVESVAKGTFVESAKHTELVALLKDAQDEITRMTEREEAASAIIDETTDRVVALQAKVEEAKVREDTAASVIADLTGAAGKQTSEKVTESATTDSPVQTLAKQIAEGREAAKVDPTLPKPGEVKESSKDAGEVVTKKAIHEGGTPTGKKSGADLLGPVTKRIAESTALSFR